LLLDFFRKYFADLMRNQVRVFVDDTAVYLTIFSSSDHQDSNMI
jgi:hypothetical protein